MMMYNLAAAIRRKLVSSRVKCVPLRSDYGYGSGNAEIDGGSSAAVLLHGSGSGLRHRAFSSSSNQSAVSGGDEGPFYYWRPPRKGFLKLNLDGAKNNNPKICGVSSLLRDDKGYVKYQHIYRLSTEEVNAVSHPPEIEFVAFKMGLLQLIERDIDISKVVFETDNHELKDKLDKVAAGETVVGKIFKIFVLFDIISLLPKNMEKFEINLVKREANMFADYLSTESLYLENPGDTKVIEGLGVERGNHSIGYQGSVHHFIADLKGVETERTPRDFSIKLVF